MTNIEAFLNPSEEAKIIEAIRLAEENTSGEIRVHLEASYRRKKNPFEVLDISMAKEEPRKVTSIVWDGTTAGPGATRIAAS